MKRQGFVLAETVIAMALFGIFSTAVLSGFLFATVQLRHIRERTARTQVLVDKTEILRTMRPEQIRALPAPYVVRPVSFRSDYSEYLSAVSVTVDGETWTTICTSKEMPLPPTKIKIKI